MSDKKVVINTCHGGFSLSAQAAMLLNTLGVEVEGEVYDSEECYYLEDEISRHDPRLVMVAEHLGEAAFGSHAHLEVVTLTGDHYIIRECDGREWVVEPEDIDWIEID